MPFYPEPNWSDVGPDRWRWVLKFLRHSIAYAIGYLGPLSPEKRADLIQFVGDTVLDEAELRQQAQDRATAAGDAAKQIALTEALEEHLNNLSLDGPSKRES